MTFVDNVFWNMATIWVFEHCEAGDSNDKADWRIAAKSLGLVLRRHYALSLHASKTSRDIVVRMSNPTATAIPRFATADPRVWKSNAPILVHPYKEQAPVLGADVKFRPLLFWGRIAW